MIEETNEPVEIDETAALDSPDPETIAQQATALELDSPSNEFESEQIPSSEELAVIEETYYKLDRMIRSYNSTIHEDTELSEAGMRLESKMNELYRPLVEFRSWFNETENIAEESASDNLPEPLMTSRGLSYFPNSKSDEDDKSSLIEAVGLGAEPSQDFVDTGIEISGFLDGVWEKSTSSSEKGSVALNQVELDLAREISDRTAIELAIAYGDAFEVGAATIQVTLWDQESDDGHTRHLSSCAVAVGQFDVPFGLDFEEYASIDRKLVTGPVAVESIHDAWNDVGAVSSLCFGPGTVDAWLVQGFESRYWNSDEEISEDVTDEDERWLDATPEFSTGLRMNYEITDRLESGFSLSRGWSNQRPAMSLAGIHARAGTESFGIRGEWLYGREFESIDPSKHSGMYIQSMASLGQFFFIARYDKYSPDGEDPETWLSSGLGYDIGGGVEYRAEYRMAQYGGDNQIYIQLVAGF